MRKAIWLLIAVVLIVVFALLLLDHNPAILMLQISSKSYSIKLWSAILFLILVCIAIYLIFSLISLVYRAPKRFKTSWKIRQEKSKKGYFFNGLGAYLSSDSTELNKNLSILLKDNDIDNRFVIYAALFLLDDFTRLQKDIGAAEYKNIIKKLEDLNLSDYEKFLVRYLRAKLFQKTNQDLASCVYMKALLDDLANYYSLPKVGLSHYLNVLESYGNTCLRIGQYESIDNFIKFLNENSWLQKSIRSQNAIQTKNIKQIYQNAFVKLFKINDLRLKDRALEIFDIIKSSGLLNDSIIISYVSYCSDILKDNKIAKDELVNYLSRCFSEKVFCYYSQMTFITDKEKLTLGQKAFANKKFNPSSETLRVMGKYV